MKTARTISISVNPWERRTGKITPCTANHNMTVASLIVEPANKQTDRVEAQPNWLGLEAAPCFNAFHLERVAQSKNADLALLRLDHTWMLGDGIPSRTVF
jgi:hypothetical protein